jgi:SET domain-containing protein
LEDQLVSDIYLGESKIHSQGAFARRSIPAGSLVVRMGGVVIHKDQVYEGLRALQIGPDTYLSEDHENPGKDDLINHSCAPNLGFLDGSVTLYALKDIEKDEELGFDYSSAMNEPGWEVECQCGAEACRGKIQSFCDLPEDLKNRLRPVALAYLR